ncbi:MAG: response regulator transcription factor [Alphaproteobacteria bacterium]|nr:response regulator transcription factor [Alphaproteobacteria bacterium]
MRYILIGENPIEDQRIYEALAMRQIVCDVIPCGTIQDINRHLSNAIPTILIINEPTSPQKFYRSIVKSIRDTGHLCGIVVLGRQASFRDPIDYLDAGADSYVPLPVEPEVLDRVIKTVVRRTSAHERPCDVITLCGGVFFDQTKGRIQIQDTDILLTASEFKVLKTLIEANGKIVSTNSLKEGVYQDLMRAEKHQPSNCIQVFVNRIRDKLGLLDKSAVIETVRSEGYRWVQGHYNTDRLIPVGTTCINQNINLPPVAHVPQ